MNECYMAVNKTTGQFFGGKSGGTHVGYNKLHYLKNAMTYRGIKGDKQREYHFVKLSFDESLTPTITKLEEE